MEAGSKSKLPNPTPDAIHPKGELVESKAVSSSIPTQHRPDEASGKAVMVSKQLTVTHSGPIPPPSVLEAYNQCIPDGANRIMLMAEAQSAHRIKIEQAVIQSQQDQSVLGQRFAFILAVMALGLTGYLAAINQPWVAGTVSSTTIAGLVTAFLRSKAIQKADLAQKRESVESTQKPSPASNPPTRAERRRRK